MGSTVTVGRELLEKGQALTSRDQGHRWHCVVDPPPHWLPGQSLLK